VQSKGTDTVRDVRTDHRTLRIIRDRFVFDSESGEFFLLSAEGVWILRAIVSGQCSAEIEAELMKRYGINRGTAMRDFEQFKFRLMQLGLISEKQET